MEKASNIVNKIEMMFCSNKLKRLHAIKSLQNIISDNCLTAKQKDLINICESFIDNEPQIMLEVLNQLKILKNLNLNDKSKFLWVQLLVKYCKLDEQQVALQAIQIILKLAQKDQYIIFEIVSLLNDPTLSTSILSLVILIVNKIQDFKNHQQIKLFKILKSIVENRNSSLCIILCRKLSILVQNANSIDLLCELFDSILEKRQQLIQLLCIEPLIIFYKRKPNFCISKLKQMFQIANWRIKIGLCSYFELIGDNITNFHFKNNFEKYFLQMLVSEEKDIQLEAIKVLPVLAKNMCYKQAFNQLSPIITSLIRKSDIQITNQLSKVIYKLIFEFQKQKSNELMMLILTPINIQERFQILCQFYLLAIQKTNQIRSMERQLQNLIASLNQISDWKVNLKILNKALKMVKNSETYCIFSSLNWILYLQKNLQNRVNKVRELAQKVLIQTIKQNKPSSVQEMIIPILQRLKNHSIYLVRQKAVSIIIQVLIFMGLPMEKAHQIYKQLLHDKVSNVRLMAVENLNKLKKNQITPEIKQSIYLLKEDEDKEVKQAALKLEL